MRYSTQIKPISYVKAHAAELLDRITEEREPIIITQNGEARAVLVDVFSYEQMMEETQTLLKILAHWPTRRLRPERRFPLKRSWRSLVWRPSKPDALYCPVYQRGAA